MIPLILSIFSSSVIFVIFKLFDRYKIDTFQAIVTNYLTAFVLGIILFKAEIRPESFGDTHWLSFAFITSFLFIGLFFLMGKSSQNNGVSSTSIAVKMSMVVSIIGMILLYNETLTFLKILGVLLALLGVYLVSSKDKTSSKNSTLWMLLVLFIGSGILDFTLNYVQAHVLHQMTVSIYSAISLGFAGVLGLLILVINLIKGTNTFAIRNVVGGILLGIPNYFSIYFLMLSYKSTGWNDSTVLTVTNVSIVLLSSIIGFIIFNESASVKKITGLFAAISAIILLYFANN